MDEHRRSTERRFVPRRTPWGEYVDIEQFRFVCSCGYATSWRKRIEVALRQMDRHALDGQLSQSW